MAKNIPLAQMDVTLNNILTLADKMVVCSAQPTTFTEANVTFALADVAMADADFALANGDVSGRKISTVAKNGVVVDANGTATHIAIIDTVNSLLKAITTCTSQAINTGGTVDIPAYKVWEIQQPT